MIKDLRKYSDADLLILFRGDKNSFDSAFLEVYNRYSTHVYFYIQKIMEDEDIAKDIFQDTFIKFSEYVIKQNDITSFKSYLLKIARNFCLTSKSNKKEIDKNINFDLINLDEFGYNPNYIQDNEKADLIKYIEDCVNMLEDDEREILICRQYQGMNYDDIEFITGISQSHARTMLFRAKEKLKNLIRPYLASRESK